MYACGCTINIHRTHSQREESEKEYALALKSLRVGTHIPRHIHTLMIFVCIPNNENIYSPSHSPISTRARTFTTQGPRHLIIRGMTGAYDYLINGFYEAELPPPEALKGVLMQQHTTDIALM